MEEKHLIGWLDKTYAYSLSLFFIAPSPLIGHFIDRFFFIICLWLCHDVFWHVFKILNNVFKI